MHETHERLLLVASRSDVVDDGRLDETYRLVLRAAREGLRVARAGVWMLLPDQSGIRCELLIDDANETDHERLVLTRAQFPRYFAALATERAILADDACADPQTSEFNESYLQPLGIVAMLDVPIRHRGEMVGIICCEHIGGPRVWAAEEARFAAALADLIGRAITANHQIAAERALRSLNATLEARIIDRTRALEHALGAATLARQVAERANGAKSRFLANTSHELRTPLGSILGYCDLLLNETPAEQRLGDAREELTVIQGAASHLLAMINDILDIARIEAGKLEIEVRPWPVAPLIAEVVATIRPQSEARGSALAVEVAADVDAVLADLRGVRQVLLNLVANAVKFGRGQPIEIVAADEGEEVAIRVIDRGDGIAPEDLERLFEPFFRVNAAASGEGGTGLGLSISQTIAEAMEGSIRAESEVGVGSTFTLRLPRASTSAGV